MMRRKHYIAAALLVVILLALRFVIQIGDRAPGIYMVTRVIDGDTVELNGKEKLRLGGIDTPEQDQPFHDSAKAFLAALTLNRKVRVEPGFRKRDGYGRLLGYMFMDSMFVNAEILKLGLGRMYLFPEDRREPEMLERLFAAQREALAGQIGVWGLPVVMEEAYYIGNRSGMRFHRAECPSAQSMKEKNKIIFRTRDEAFYEGYSPCRNCQP